MEAKAEISDKPAHIASFGEYSSHAPTSRIDGRGGFAYTVSRKEIVQEDCQPYPYGSDALQTLLN